VVVAWLGLAACGADKAETPSAPTRAPDAKAAEAAGAAPAAGAPGAAAPAAVEAPAFEAFAAGEAPLRIRALSLKIDENVLGPEGSKNLRADFEVELVKAVEDGTMISVKSTCRLGDEFLTDTSSPLIQPETLQPGETKKADAILYGMSGFEGDPTTCEIGFFVSKMISMDPPKHLADHCWSDGKVSDGTCDGFARPASDGTPIEITSATAELEEIQFGEHKGRKDIRQHYTVRVGTAIEPGKSIFVKTACKVGDETIVDESPVLAMFTYVLPGESLRVSGSSYPLKGVASDPSQCELTYSLKGLFDSEGGEFATYCFVGGKLAEGKCG